ncbi:hypothetical protein YC2023_100936 [Brassica napus]
MVVIYQKGEKVKSMAQRASEAVKNKLGMNSDNDNDYKNKNPLDRNNPNNTTCPSMPEDHHYCRISSDTSTTTFTACINSTYNAFLTRFRAPFMSSLSLSLIWLESPYAPSVEGFPQSMEFSETFQFVCQRSATGDGDDDILKFTENAENSEGLAQAVPKVEGNALGWFHRAAITSLFR